MTTSQIVMLCIDCAVHGAWLANLYWMRQFHRLRAERVEVFADLNARYDALRDQHNRFMTDTRKRLGLPPVEMQ